MASADVLMPSATTSSWTAPPADNTIPPLAKDAFDPEKHLNFAPPAKVFTMKDIGLPEHTGVSPLAVSEPFPLFTPEAVMRMREEVLSHDVLTKCQYSSNLAQAQLRGYADKLVSLFLSLYYTLTPFLLSPGPFPPSSVFSSPFLPSLPTTYLLPPPFSLSNPFPPPRYAPFVYSAWKHPTTLAHISSVAGIDLTLQFDFEIGHINLSSPPPQKPPPSLTTSPSSPSTTTDTDVEKDTPTDIPIVGWHRDSYPFVCVTMLSDCTTMLGGETALRTGRPGEILKIRSPQMGHAIVLQGRYIEHQALAAFGSAERITMVTSYRPRSAMVRDDSVLSTVRGISDLGELYYQFLRYRLEIVGERVGGMLRELEEGKREGRGVEVGRVKKFLGEMEDLLARTNKEIVEEGEVRRGH